jgi:hypothetical protein
MTPLQTLIPLASTGVAVMLAVDKKIVRQLRAAGALDASRAVAYRPPGPFGPMRLRRLVGVRAVGVVNQRYYLDENGYAAWRRSRRKRALIVLGGLLSGLAIATLRGDVSRPEAEKLDAGSWELEAGS